MTGVRVGTYGNSSHVTLIDSVIAINQEDGVSIAGAKVDIENCTIYRNGGWAVAAVLYPNFRINNSVLLDNAAGAVSGKRFQSRQVKIQNCVIVRNGSIQLNNAASGQWDARGNYWGPKLTGPSAASGISKMTQGSILIQDHLRELPKQCGSSIREINGKKFGGRALAEIQR